MNNIIKKIPFKNIAIALALAIFFSLDRYLKIAAFNLKVEESKELLGNILTFNFTPNYNIAFSLPLGGPALNIAIITLVILIALIVLFLNISKTPHYLEIICLTFILGGAISNLIDRLNYGYVIDYLYLQYFTVFNLADIMISGGAIILIIKNLRSK